MLTNMYYFGFYKPYIVKEYNGIKKDKPDGYQNIGFTKMKSLQTKAVLLNKAYNTEVIGFVKGIAQSIINLRESIKKLEISKDKYIKYSLFKYYNNEKEQVAKDIENFLDCFNDVDEIISNSDNLKPNIDFNNEISIIKNNIHIKLYFIEVYNVGKLIFDKIKFDISSQREILVMLYKLDLLLSDIKKKLELFLIEPISTYMKFINLSCYYNYKIENAKDDTVKIIQNGLLIDIFL